MTKRIVLRSDAIYKPQVVRSLPNAAIVNGWKSYEVVGIVKGRGCFHVTLDVVPR